MTPATFMANPLADAVVRVDAGAAERIEVAAYSAQRGFLRGRLIRGETPGYEAARRFLDGASGVAELSPAESMALWQAGLLVLPQERAAPFVPPQMEVGAERAAYLRQGFTELPACVTAEAVGILVGHYRALVASGQLRRGDSQADRFIVHNDAAGRVVQRALRGMVERIVGNPVKGSYTYASLYCGGTDLPVHRDRPQCKYSVSLLIEHRPAPPDGRSPWPVQVYAEPGAAPVECFQTLGGGILFRGHEIPHGRPALPSDQDSWVMLLHYVDADFEGSLD